MSSIYVSNLCLIIWLNLCITCVLLYVCRKSTFKNTYSPIIYLKNGSQLWLLDDQVAINPLAMRKAISRPKKMRNKVNDETRNPYVLPIKLTIIICHKCGAIRHNKRSCKGKRAVDRAIPKGGNKKNGITCAKYDGKKKKRIHLHQRTEIRRKKRHVQQRSEAHHRHHNIHNHLKPSFTWGHFFIFFIMFMSFWCHGQINITSFLSV